jgi:methionyl-tRNA formyltransferase
MVMRVVFLGTPEFATPALKALIGSGERYDVRAVITQPDRPAGRGQRLTPPPVKVAAQWAGVPVFQTERLREDSQIYQLLEREKPELMVVVAFGQILPREFFAYPRLGTLNIHASMLPKYRGAAPIVHALLNGETRTGTTIMKIDEGMDTGDIVAQRSLPIEADITAGELERVLAGQGAELLMEAIPAYVSGGAAPVPQDAGQASYAPRIRKEEGRIEWSAPAESLHNRIRAFNPWPGAFSLLRGQVVKIWRSRRSDLTGIKQGPGEIVDVSREGITVACGGGSALTLTETQLAGRHRNPAFDMANGLKLRPGDKFGEE